MTSEILRCLECLTDLLFLLRPVEGLSGMSPGRALQSFDRMLLEVKSDKALFLTLLPVRSKLRQAQKDSLEFALLIDKFCRVGSERPEQMAQMVALDAALTAMTACKSNLLASIKVPA